MSEKKCLPRKIEAKWYIAVASFLMVCTVLGFCNGTKGIYFTAIVNALGISRSALSLANSFRYITTTIVNLFFGALVMRFGEKKLICAGFIAMIIACVLYSTGDHVFYFYIGGIFLGMGVSWTTTTMVGSLVGKWFRENKGAVMGVILAANGIGGAISVQIVTPMIYREGDVWGYQSAYRFVAVLLLVVGVIVLLMMKGKEPQEDAVQGAGSNGKKRKTRDWSGITFSAALHKPYFYATIFCIFITGFILQGLVNVSTPVLQDSGLSPSYVATVLSFHSITLTVFKAGVGAFYDRRGLRMTMNVCYITAVVVMIILVNITNSLTGMILAMVFGVFSSLALPLETIMIPIIASDLFGQNSYNKILGIIASANYAGFALGGPVFNLCYDFFGSYKLAIYIACSLILAAFIVMQFVITEANKQHALVGSAD